MSALSNVRSLGVLRGVGSRDLRSLVRFPFSAFEFSDPGFGPDSGHVFPDAVFPGLFQHGEEVLGARGIGQPDVAVGVVFHPVGAVVRPGVAGPAFIGTWDSARRRVFNHGPTGTGFPRTAVWRVRRRRWRGRQFMV